MEQNKFSVSTSACNYQKKKKKKLETKLTQCKYMIKEYMILNSAEFSLLLISMLFFKLFCS